MTESTLLDSAAIWISAGLFSIAAIAVSIQNAYKHVQYYTKPHLQRMIIRILLIVPMYSCWSFMSLVVPGKSDYFDLVRDCYESFVIYW
jgi:hypothetical protein